MYNGLSVGDTITITNPSLDSETYTMTISGIYTSSENNDFSMSMFGASQDPANRIYMSAVALQAVLDLSEDNSTTRPTITAEKQKQRSMVRFPQPTPLPTLNLMKSLRKKFAPSVLTSPIPFLPPILRRLKTA